MAIAGIGHRSASSATGDQSAGEIKPSESGEPQHAVAAAYGGESKARAPIGSAIVCVYRNKSGDLIHIRASKVGDNNIKPDTWYTLNEIGEFKEV